MASLADSLTVTPVEVKEEKVGAAVEGEVASTLKATAPPLAVE